MVAVSLTLIGTAGCGAANKSGAPLMRRLQAVPVPAAAVRVSEEHRDGDFERGPSAALEYSLPSPLQLACPALLGSYVQAGYRLFDFAEKPEPIVGLAAFCAREIAKRSPGAVQPSVIAIAYPPAVATGHPRDGLSVVLTPAKAGDAHPQGTHLRLAVS